MELIFIDDNSTVLKFIELMLKKEAILTESDKLNTYVSVQSFMNSEKSNEIEIQKKLTNIDVVICDYDLGKASIDGLEFLNNIIDCNYKGTCILLTGDDTYELRKQLELSPSIYYVVKNSNNDKTTSTISQLGKILNTIRGNKNVSE